MWPEISVGGLGFGLKFGPVDVSSGSNMSKLVAATASYVIEFCHSITVRG